MHVVLRHLQLAQTSIVVVLDSAHLQLPPALGVPHDALLHQQPADHLVHLDTPSHFLPVGDDPVLNHTAPFTVTVTASHLGRELLPSQLQSQNFVNLP